MYLIWTIWTDVSNTEVIDLDRWIPEATGDNRAAAINAAKSYLRLRFPKKLETPEQIRFGNAINLQLFYADNNKVIAIYLKAEDVWPELA